MLQLARNFRALLGQSTLLPFRQPRTRRRHRLVVTHQSIYLSRLPGPFAGLRLVHLSDIHHGLYTSLEQVERVVDLANRLCPDVVALTGDFVTQSPNYIAPVARALGRLQARLGIFAVLGNHDFRVGADAVAAALERHGIEVLRNRSVQIRSLQASLTLAGVDDFSYGQDSLRMALRQTIVQEATILLSHNPAVAVQAAAFGVDLVLSGHTHGGQLRLIRSSFPRAFARRRGLRPRFRHGWERVGHTQLYISRGIGTVVVPVRFRCPAEIPVLRLEIHNHHADPTSEPHAHAGS